MERLPNFTKRVIAVDKAEIDALDKKWKERKKTSLRKATT